MSRNLLSTSCWFCSEPVVLVGPPHAGTADDFGEHYAKAQYGGMIVADAECSVCKAKYLAWLDGTSAVNTYGHPWPKPVRDESGALTIQDLSFRSSFNDEPGSADYPEFEVAGWTPTLKPWPKCERCGKAKRDTYSGVWECTDHRCVSLAAGEVLCVVHDSYHKPEFQCWRCKHDAEKAVAK